MWQINFLSVSNLKNNGSDLRQLKIEFRKIYLMGITMERRIRCQFHQHFLRPFFADILAPKNCKAAQSAFVRNFATKMHLRTKNV